MFLLVSTWTLPSPADRAWQVISDVESWPGWWPGVTEARVVRPGGPDGLGQRTYLVVRSPLGYRLRFGVEITAARAPYRAEASVVGELVGTGAWSVEPKPDGCRATITWQVAPAREPLRSLSRPLGQPLTWAHGYVMERGQRGLVNRL